MREVLRTLLEMENEARNAAFVVDDTEHTTQAEIKRRVAQIEYEAKTRIASFKHEIANETHARMSEIETEYQQKTAMLASFFAREHETLVAKITNEVLYGH